MYYKNTVLIEEKERGRKKRQVGQTCPLGESRWLSVGKTPLKISIEDVLTKFVKVDRYVYDKTKSKKLICTTVEFPFVAIVAFIYKYLIGLAHLELIAKKKA